MSNASHNRNQATKKTFNAENNVYKTDFNLTLFRVKNSRSLHKTFNVEPLYLQHENTGQLFLKKTELAIVFNYFTDFTL